MNRLAAAALAALALAAPARAAVVTDEYKKEHLSAMYFAPTDQVFYRMRMPFGEYFEFQRDLYNPEYMAGMRGWLANIDEAGNIIVRSSRKPGKGVTYVFSGGRLVRQCARGVTNDVPYEVARKPLPGVPKPFFFGTLEESAALGKKEIKKSAKELDKLLFKNKWNKKERLSWPFRNPNENGFLYAGLTLFAFSLLVCAPRLWMKFAAGAATVVAGEALVLTFSRGSWLAAFLGFAAIAAFGWRRMREKVTFRFTVSVLAVLLAGTFAVFAARGVSKIGKNVSRGFTEKTSWSNHVRYDMWKLAPRMMADAPGGWGSFHVGRAFLDWYQDIRELSAPGSLMNDHFTRMARYGHAGRVVYVFSWFALLGVLAAWGLKRRNGGPFAVWLAFAAAAWFNPIMPKKWLWAVPSISLLPVVVDAGRLLVARRLPGRKAAVVLPCIALAAAAAAFATVCGIESYGETLRVPVKIRVDGGRVMVKGPKPSIWVFDDGRALGGVFTCKEIRAAFIKDPSRPAVGYVKKLDQLPETGVRRLILGGYAGDAWLKKVCEDIVKDEEGARSRLPAEVIFISPPFPPSAIPEPLFDVCRVKYVTGEFNAMFDDAEFAERKPWIDIIPTMELYILGWMGYAK
jgi:hypothetical protein